jgi:hypothetical protein
MAGTDVFQRMLVEANGFSESRRQAVERVANKNRDSHDAMRLIQDRDPCFKCGTRKDRHDEFGCGRWRAG